MLIQANFRYQFYEIIKGGHTVIIVNADIDALCATTILTYALSCDDVAYSIRPVRSRRGLVEAINKHKSQAKNFVLVNCVGTGSLLDLGLTLPAEVAFFVLESRRPISLHNIYDGTNVRVLAYEAEVEDWRVPDHQHIFSADSDNEEEDDDASLSGDSDNDDEEIDGEDDGESFLGAGEGSESGGGPPRRKRRRRKTRRSEEDEEEEESSETSRLGGGGGRRRRGEDVTAAIERRALAGQRKSTWKKNRATLLWNYYMKAWHSTPVSVMMLELAHELGKSSAELMWYAAVGLSSALADQLISIEAYTEICVDRMRPFIRKFAPRENVTLEQSRGDGQLRISFDNGLLLPLFTHWTLQESMTNDPLFMCKSQIWSQRGEQDFRHLLAKLGITRKECAQNWQSLVKERKGELFDIIHGHVDAGFGTFTSHLGYDQSYTAIDFARVLALHLECRPVAQSAGAGGGVLGEQGQLAAGGEKSSLQKKMHSETASVDLCERFMSARSFLQRFTKFGGRNVAGLAGAISGYKLALHAVNDLVRRSIQQSHVIAAARYFLLTLHLQSPAIPYLTSSRHCLFLFSHTILRAFATTKTSRRTKPLIVAIPLTTATNHKHYDWLLGGGGDPSAAAEGEGEEAVCGEEENPTAIADHLQLQQQQQFYLVTGIMPLSEIVTDTARKSVIGRAFEHVAQEASIPIRKCFDSNKNRLKFFNSLEARLEVI